jgi:hypothetical protein
MNEEKLKENEEWKKNKSNNKKNKNKIERRKKKSRKYRDNEITKKIEIEEKRWERDTLL